MDENQKFLDFSMIFDLIFAGLFTVVTCLFVVIVLSVHKKSILFILFSKESITWMTCKR
jgi:hypothetical protein